MEHVENNDCSTHVKKGLVTFDTFDEFCNIVEICKKNKTTLLVCFSTTWCGPCKRIKPFLVKQSEKNINNNRICIAKTDHGDDDMMDHLSKIDIRITAFPFFALISHDNKNATKTWAGPNEKRILEELKAFV